jgi:hypothetical protein
VMPQLVHAARRSRYCAVSLPSSEAATTSPSIMSHGFDNPTLQPEL